MKGTMRLLPLCLATFFFFSGFKTLSSPFINGGPGSLCSSHRSEGFTHPVCCVEGRHSAAVLISFYILITIYLQACDLCQVSVLHCSSLPNRWGNRFEIVFLCNPYLELKKKERKKRSPSLVWPSLWLKKVQSISRVFPHTPDQAN